MKNRPVTQQEWNELEAIRQNAVRNGGMAGEMYLDKYLSISSRLASDQKMPAQHVRTFWHFYQVRKAQRAVDARAKAPVNKKQLNEAEAEFEALLDRAGL